MNLRKMLIISGIFFIPLFLLNSCKKSNKEIEAENLTTAIKKSKIDNSYKWIIVLPGLGCHGCIQEGEAFMRDNINHSHLLFVLTKISSLKILQQKTGIKIEGHPNVYIDRQDVFNIQTDNSIYPCIIRMEKGKIAEHEFQSPQNGAAFRRLQKIVLPR